MNNKSIWEVDIEKEYFDNEIKKEVDILIIGGGITGVSLAYLLKDYRGSVCLIDKDEIGKGVTARTTAKISYLQGTVYQSLEKSFNKKVADKYFQSQKDAIKLIKRIILDNHISCDLEEVSSILFTMCNSNVSKVKKEKQLLEDFGVKTVDVYDDDIEYGIKSFGNYTFHPLKYLYSLVDIIKKNILLCEGVLAKNISLNATGSYDVVTNKGLIKARRVVVCNHYPFFLFPTFIPLKTYIKREYVCAGKVSKPCKVTAINVDKELYSIRYYKDYLIYVSHKDRLTGNIDYSDYFEKSQKRFYELFGVKPEYTFINQDVISNDLLPFIGEVRNNLYIATGYNAWGMTNGVIASQVIYDLITYNTSSYKKLFDPNRGNIPLFVSSFFGSFHYAKAYVEALFKKNTPSYVKIDNVLYGIYVDDHNHKHIVKLICPHMKCSLVFNQAELTWDCPCHGSRFTIDGDIIEGPAIQTIKKD